MNFEWLGKTGFPGRREATGIKPHPEPIGLPKPRPDAVQIRMLTNIPLGLVSPDRDEVARLGAMLVPARLIMNRHVHLEFKNRDEPFA